MSVLGFLGAVAMFAADFRTPSKERVGPRKMKGVEGANMTWVQWFSRGCGHVRG